MRMNYKSGAYIDTFKSAVDKLLWDMSVVDKFGNILFTGTNLSFPMISEKINKYEKEIDSERTK